MNDLADGARGIGDNMPPESPIDRAHALVASANKWLADYPTIADPDIAGRAQDFVTKLRANKADLEAEWKAEREPHDLAIGALRTRYNTPLQLIGIALTKAGERLTPWLNAERDRLAKEARQREQAAKAAAAEVERARREAETSGTIESELAARNAEDAAKRAAKAAVKPVQSARVKGDYSKRSAFITTRWHAEVIDAGAALDHFWKDPVVKLAALEAATRLASALARETKDERKAPPGFRFVKTERAT